MNTVSKVLFLIIIGLLFYDIGNINAIRQGTEGFYLLISQEMYEARDLLSPRIYGDFHWSKPPFQFWLPMPFYYLFGGSFLTWSRISILLFSLICTLLISFWYERELKRNWFEAFGFLLFPVYFIKYSRIFMMEMTLTYLTTLGILIFYSYLKRPSIKLLLVGSLTCGLSVLVKGPVSLVMLTPPIFLYAWFYRNKDIKKPFFYLTFATLFGSLWFFLSYLKFGSEFFNYFFIRENLGKFAAKNYPISSVIQGLLIYSFPAILLLFPIFKEKKVVVLKDTKNIFLLLGFVFFYFLWFLPKQKSHHYAIPAIPLLLIFISYNFHQLKKASVMKYYKLLNAISSIIFTLGFLIVALTFYFEKDLNPHGMREYISGAFFCIAIWTYLKKRPIKKLKAIQYLIPMIFLWQFILPLGILPTVPNSVATKIQKTKRTFVAYRKPFFIKEAVQKDVEFLPEGGLSSGKIQKGDLVYIGRADIAKSLTSYTNFRVLESWTVWKRGSKAKDILKAISNKNLSKLQEKFFLVEKI